MNITWMNIDKTTKSSDVERGFLACCAKDSERLIHAISEGVSADWFAINLHSQIWESCVRNQTDDLIDVAVSTDKHIDAPYEKIISVFEAVDTSAGYLGYYKTLTENYRLRQIRTSLLSAIDKTTEAVFSDEILSDLDRDITRLQQQDLKTLRAGTEVLKSAQARILLRQHSDGKDFGIRTGLRALDMYTKGGWKPSQLICVAARTGLGKTAFAVQMAIAAMEEEKKVYFVNMEMEAEEVMHRMQSHKSDCAIFPIEDGTASASEKDRWNKADEWLNRTQRDEFLWLDDEAGLSVSHIRARARKLAKKGLDIIIIDYIQIISSEKGQERQSNYERVSYASRMFKILAKELKIPVVILAQLKRDADEIGREPKLSDLKESGAIEQDTDIVLFVWKNKKETDERKLKVAKQRNGKVGKNISLTFYGATSKFKPEATLH